MQRQYTSGFYRSEMSELVSDCVNYAEKRWEHLKRVVEICESADAVRDHECTTNVKKNRQTEHTGMLDLKCILQSDK